MRHALTALVITVTTQLLAGMPAAQQSAMSAHLLEQFKSTSVFWQQFEVAKEIAKVGDAQVLEVLEPLLGHADRHLRANVAFVFARLGDPRGLETIRVILTDHSDRPLGQGIPGGSFNTAAPRWWSASQIRADRYYAVHMLGELRDSRGVDMLIPLLADPEVNYHVAWAFGQIGDRRAIGPLIRALEDREALVRVSAIQALEALDAREALPQLRGLLNDQAIPSAGLRVPVADTAKAAIAKLQKEP
jgi:HEAT repeat protein